MEHEHPLELARLEGRAEQERETTAAHAERMG
jgi:hypothetical protein